MHNFLRFEDVSYVRNGITILDKCTFTLNSGESLAILGRNGAGKTTLINLLYGYFWPTSGRIFVSGEEYGTTPIKPIQDTIGILQSNHQDQLLQKSLSSTEVIITGIHRTLGLYKPVTENDLDLAYKALASIQMEAKADQKFSTLSSGEKSKILLLRALGIGIKLLILDEPTAALDFTARYHLEKSMEMIKNANPNLTRILITHRVEEIPEDFHKVMLLKEGKILSYGDKDDVLTKESLSDLYELELDLKKISQRFFISGIR